MSLGVAISLLHTLGDNHPLEAMQGEHRERKPLEPTKIEVYDSTGEVTQEEMTWLMS